MTYEELIEDWKRAFVRRRDQLVLAMGDPESGADEHGLVEVFLSGLEGAEPVQLLPIMYATAQAWAMVDLLAAVSEPESASA